MYSVVVDTCCQRVLKNHFSYFFESESDYTFECYTIMQHTGVVVELFLKVYTFVAVGGRDPLPEKEC